MNSETLSGVQFTGLLLNKIIWLTQEFILKNIILSCSKQEYITYINLKSKGEVWQVKELSKSTQLYTKHLG